jgi:hypothetical protein
MTPYAFVSLHVCIVKPTILMEQCALKNVNNCLNTTFTLT